jgi:hypothetical protein
VAPLLPCDPERLARLLDPVADRVVLDDFFRGDGAGGRRSAAALALLRAHGFGSWAEPGYARHAAEVLRHALGSGRVVESQEGFNDLGWLELAGTRTAAVRESPPGRTDSGRSLRSGSPS